MMGSSRNRTMERMASVSIAASDLAKETHDSRNAMRHGTVETICAQYGVTVRREGKLAVLSARRGRLQAVVELLHYCAVDYLIVS